MICSCQPGALCTHSTGRDRGRVGGGLDSDRERERDGNSDSCRARARARARDSGRARARARISVKICVSVAPTCTHLHCSPGTLPFQSSNRYSLAHAQSTFPMRISALLPSTTLASSGTLHHSLGLSIIVWDSPASALSDPVTTRPTFPKPNRTPHPSPPTATQQPAPAANGPVRPVAVRPVHAGDCTG